jgi:hypothetical protein
MLHISVCAGLPHCLSHMVIIIFYISYIQIERTTDFVYTYILCVYVFGYYRKYFKYKQLIKDTRQKFYNFPLQSMEKSFTFL